MSCPRKMIQLLLVAVLAVAQVVDVKAPLNLLPILRSSNTNNHHNSKALPRAYHRSISDEKTTGDDLDALSPENNAFGPPQRANDVIPERQVDENVELAVQDIVLDLLENLARYEDRYPQRPSPAASDHGLQLGKRLWGQRRNIQTRFASFGTKLTPSRKLLMGSSGATLLRYGRNAHQE